MAGLNGVAGQTALVTGAARGLGREVVRQLLDAGVNVVALVRTGDGLNECKSSAIVTQMTADLREANVGDNVVRRLADLGIMVDILINCAGVYLDDPRRITSDLLDRDLGMLEDTLSVNLMGAARMAWALMPGMIMRGRGRIVNVTSGLGRLGDFDQNGAFYRLSKLALNGLTVLLAERGRDHGILVNAVCPGWVRTDMGGAAAPVPVAQGARGIVWAAQLPDQGPTGLLFRDGHQLDWFAPSPSRVSEIERRISG